MSPAVIDRARRGLLAGAGLGAFRWAAAAPAGRRLVCLSGAITEVAYALGAGPDLVGTDTTSTYPEAALKTPKVGYLRQLSAEGLLSLRPDRVLGTTEAGPATVLAQLREAGVLVELVQADHSWDEVRRKVELVGRASGREDQARALWTRLQAQWSTVQQEVARAQGQPRALFILSHGGAPQVAGRGTAADAVLRLAGARNVMDQFEGYRPLTAEAMASAAPEVLVTTTQGLEAQGGGPRFWQRPELALTPAARRQALVTLEASHLLGFGPRLPEAIAELARGLRSA
ncbi:MAG: ABC transporter substrate-binding protein [Curvibacter sp.]|nr:ABC transporter substrate-binding protein [Curvibacter sp.]